MYTKRARRQGNLGLLRFILSFTLLPSLSPLLLLLPALLAPTAAWAFLDPSGVSGGALLPPQQLLQFHSPSFSTPSLTPLSVIPSATSKQQLPAVGLSCRLSRAQPDGIECRELLRPLQTRPGRTASHIPQTAEAAAVKSATAAAAATANTQHMVPPVRQTHTFRITTCLEKC